MWYWRWKQTSFHKKKQIIIKSRQAGISPHVRLCPNLTSPNLVCFPFAFCREYGLQIYCVLYSPQDENSREIHGLTIWCQRPVWLVAHPQQVSFLCLPFLFFFFFVKRNSGCPHREHLSTGFLYLVDPSTYLRHRSDRQVLELTLQNVHITAGENLTESR